VLIPIIIFLQVVFDVKFQQKSVNKFTKIINIRYCPQVDKNLKLDVYIPTNQKINNPTILYIHSGGWYSGDKSEIFRYDLINNFINSGFVVVSINYRLAPENIYPDFEEDAKCALNYVIKNSSSLRVDQNKIGLLGLSAGGFIALNVALSYEKPGINDKFPIVALCSPTDLSTLENPEILEMVRVSFPQIDQSYLRSISPINRIKNKKNVPVFLIQAELDHIIPRNQGVDFLLKYYQFGNNYGYFSEYEESTHSYCPLASYSDERKTRFYDELISFYNNSYIYK
jgi:acetyl esterase/lipase